MTAMASQTDSINRRRRFIRLLWMGCLMINLFVVATVTLVLQRNRDREVSQAVELSENYALILAQDIARFISKIDVTLLTVSEEVTRQMAAGGINEAELNAFLKRQDEHIPEALGLRVVDAAGVIRYAVSEVRVPQVSIADREQFIRLRDDPQAGLVISKLIMGRAAQKWIISLSRRLNSSNGEFAGEVHVAVSIDQLSEMFTRIRLGPKGNIALWDNTSVIARYSPQDTHGASVGINTPSPELRQLLDAGEVAASYHTRSGVDGIEKTFSLHRVDRYPLYLVVGLADEDYLGEWRSDAQAVAWLVVLFVLISVLGAFQLDSSWQRRENDHQALLQQEAEYTARLENSRRDADAARLRVELILDSAGEGICGVDCAGKVVFVNPAARKMYGWADGEGIGLDLHALTHYRTVEGGDYPLSECAVQMTLTDGERRTIKDDVFWRQDGSAFPVEYTVAAMAQDGVISGAVTIFRDITERKILEERITHMAMFDELTGLPNRSFLADALQRTVAVALRRQEVVGILYVDLDAFKAVNDQMGHAAGDAVLREVAARLLACVRAEDVVARLGGDEFLVITQAASGNVRENCTHLAQRIIEAVGQPIMLPEGLALVGASVGIAEYPSGEATIERCIQYADSAMYRAKNRGKGQFALAESLQAQG